MKPLYLTMQAFGPYKDREEVDFRKLSENGIFLIKGPTGSGKTTIFDAMMVALYGGGSGDDSKSRVARNDLNAWRCNQSDDKTCTEVAFTFAAARNTYRFTRKLELKRTKFAESYDMSILGEDGVYHPLAENPKANMLTDKAVELIGLTKDQFRQVVMLPQGQFEKFLIAGSEEKEKILSKIFNVDQWKKYADRFYNMAYDRKEALDKIKSEVDSLLKEDNCEKIDQMYELISGYEKRKGELETAHKEFDAEGRQAALNADRLLAASFAELNRLEAENTKLAGQKEYIQRVMVEAGEAEKAEKVRKVMEQSAEADKNKAVREKNLKMLMGRQEETAADEQKYKRMYEEKKNSSPVSELLNRRGILEGKRGIYANLDKLTEEYKAASEALTAKNGEYTESSKAYQKSLEDAKKALEQYNAYDSRAKDFRNSYFAGIYGEIARELVEDKPCPVCGSIHHPSPAQQSEDAVSKQDMEKAENTAEKAKGVWNKYDKIRDDAEKKVKEAEAELSNARVAKEKAETALISARQNLVENIADSKGLEAAIGLIDTEINKYNTELSKLEQQYQTKREVASKLEADIETAKKELELAAKQQELCASMLDNELKNNGYSDIQTVKEHLRDDKTRAELNDMISRYDENCKNNAKRLAEKREELSGKTKPDSEGFEAAEKAITDEIKSYNREHSLLENEINRLKDKSVKLQKKLDVFEKDINQAEKDLVFAKKLRGDTGVGLQRYILGIMFDQVIFEANNMLKKVHGGRYQLVRTDEKGAGNKRGLELIAHDNRMPEIDGRSVATLSGGEKFLVSLALSIGMSNIAQKSGLRIEALFIDEGFGTLDDSSINDAMYVLDTVQRSNGMIGIISHVQILESNIPTHLEVVKTDAGSRIKKI